MKVLYIPRSDEYQGFFKRWLYRYPRRYFDFWGIDGYFEAGMYSAFDYIQERSAKWVVQNAEKANNKFDVLVLHRKCDTHFKKNRAFGRVHKAVANAVQIPKVMFYTVDQAQELPSEEVMNKYDLIFKREPLKDRSQYDINQENRDKIRSTMLSCPLVFHPRYPFLKPLKPVLETTSVNEDKKKEHDVFFTGKTSRRHDIRKKTWRTLQSTSDIDTVGGLQPREEIKRSKEIPTSLRSKSMKYKEYIATMKSSRINLALDGLGEFTFRHLEIWYLGGFMIASPSIRELDLPLSAEEGEHYVAYDDTDDLLNKVRYYLNHDNQREKIAQQGQEMFEEDYNPQKYGVFIKQEIKSFV